MQGSVIGWPMAGLSGAGDFDGDWDENRRLVLHELQRLSDRDEKILDRIEALTRSMVAVRMDVSSLKAKAGVFGLIGGMIPVVIALAMLFLKGVAE